MTAASKTEIVKCPLCDSFVIVAEGAAWKTLQRAINRTEACEILNFQMYMMWQRGFVIRGEWRSGVQCNGDCTVGR